MKRETYKEDLYVGQETYKGDQYMGRETYKKGFIY